MRVLSRKGGTTKGIGAEDASLQKLLGLQHWPRYRLGGCAPPRTDDPGQAGRAAHPVGLFRLLYLLGIDNDCPIRLSAAKALGIKEQRESLTRKLDAIPMRLPVHAPVLRGEHLARVAGLKEIVMDMC